jgi:adenylyltransferase/sulfurtransferase
LNNITPKDLKARLDKGEAILIIDVREDWEVQRASLPNTINIPMQDIPDSTDRIPQDKPVVIMCHSGGRSSQVVRWLEPQGYSNLINLAGGISAWSREVDSSVPQY